MVFHNRILHFKCGNVKLKLVWDFKVLLKGEKMLSALIYRVCVMIQKVFGIHHSSKCSPLLLQALTCRHNKRPFIERVQGMRHFARPKANFLGCSLLEGWGKAAQTVWSLLFPHCVGTSCHPGSADWITVILRKMTPGAVKSVYVAAQLFFLWKVTWYYTQLFKSLGANYFFFFGKKIQQRFIKLIKSDNKDIYNVAKDFYTK